MATLTNTKIKDTYQSLLKTTNNNPVSATNQYLTDGFGNATPLSVGTNKIGIGTISPDFKLHVANNDNAFESQFVVQNINGGSSAIAQMLFQTNNFGYGLQIRSFNSDGKVEIVNTANSSTSLWTNNIERLRITSAGNVGIGTTSPSSILDIQSNSASIIRIGNNGGVNGYQLKSNVSSFADFGFFIEDYSGIDLYKAQAGASGSHHFYINGSEKMRITSAGNVGIGTTAPSSKLQVVGLPSYADNATALAGGLKVGAFYHTAGILKVVI